MYLAIFVGFSLWLGLMIALGGLIFNYDAPDKLLASLLVIAINDMFIIFILDYYFTFL